MPGHFRAADGGQYGVRAQGGGGRAGAIEGEVHSQPVNVTAIIMFLIFVGATLGITYWAARRTKTAKDFYAAGGGITGFQNGLAIAGDYMSAASFLGISGLVFVDGLRRADLLGGLAGRLADHHVPDRRAAAQPRQVHLCRHGGLPLRAEAHAVAGGHRHADRGALYLIGQMVGAGKLIQLLFGLDYTSMR